MPQSGVPKSGRVPSIFFKLKKAPEIVFSAAVNSVLWSFRKSITMNLSILILTIWIEYLYMLLYCMYCIQGVLRLAHHVNVLEEWFGRTDVDLCHDDVFKWFLRYVRYILAEATKLVSLLKWKLQGLFKILFFLNLCSTKISFLSTFSMKNIRYSSNTSLSATSYNP